MTNEEELLKKAKRDYPVGTKFKCLVTYDVYTIPENVEFKIEEDQVYSYVNGHIFHKHRDSNGKWAEIIESPKKEETSLVGRYLKALVDNPQSTLYKVGNFVKLTKKFNENRYEIDNKWTYTTNNSTSNHWELMPIGWTPEQENTPQFEVGKWYKFVWKWNSNKWYYGKFEKFEHGYYSWDLWFKIDGSNLINKPIMAKTELGEYQLLTDLSEIQPYLPDGHPDKIVKQESNIFKKGGYIVITKSEDTYDFKKDYCFKIRKESDLDWDCYIELDARNRPNGWSSKYFEWRYATPEEIAEYDRLGKPYDVTTLQKKEEKWIPQAGEWVKMVTSYGGLTIGKVYQIVKHQNISGDYYVVNHSDKPFLAPIVGRDFIKALPHEIPQQSNSIPEYVECVNSKNNNEFTIGKIYQVRGGRLTTDYGYYCESNLYPNLKNYYSNYDFKPSTKEAYEAQFKQNSISNNSIIQVGDEVKFIRYTNHNSKSKWYKPSEIFSKSDEGIIVTILDISEEDGGAYKVKTPRGYTALRRTAFELIKKASQTTTTYEKKVAEQPKNVPITTNIRIPKSISVTLPNTEKEVKLTIKKPKTIKI